jgi:two-component system phosphate regulon sensor histidine kinase PhoR
MGHVEILNSCGIDEESLWRRSLGFVSSETERLARLIEDLLSLSRLDRISLHLRPVNLHVAAEEAISALFDSAERNNVTPVIQAPTELPRVLADPDRIRQVFLNLLDNAIKYAPGSTITVRLMPEAERVRVEVNDTGPGIQHEDLQYVFEPFWRGEQVASSSRGTGLGLTIIRAILDQHQAPISVQSEFGRGTTFSFSLPLARSAEIR